MAEAGIVSTLKRLCKWSGHVGVGLVQILSVCLPKDPSMKRTVVRT